MTVLVSCWFVDSLILLGVGVELEQPKASEECEGTVCMVCLVLGPSVSDMPN